MASASSSFAGTENPLSEGGVWAAPSAYWQAARKATGLGVAVLNNDCARRYTGVSFTADHYSEVTLGLIATGGQLFYHYVMARMSATAGCYLLTTAHDLGDNVLQLWRISDAGNYTQLGADVTIGSNLVAGDVLRIEAIGTTINAKRNGTTVATRTDSTHTTGQPAVGGWAQTGSDVLFTSGWAASDITAATSSPPMPPRTPSYRFSI